MIWDVLRKYVESQTFSLEKMLNMLLWILKAQKYAYFVNSRLILCCNDKKRSIGYINGLIVLLTYIQDYYTGKLISRIWIKQQICFGSKRFNFYLKNKHEYELYYLKYFIYFC